MTLLFGLAALAVLLWMAQKYLQADPRKLAAVLKLSGGQCVTFGNGNITVATCH